MWTPIWKGLLAHKVRMLLTGLAVVLGISFVSGTYVFTDTIDRVFTDLFGASTAGVDVYVRAAADFEGTFGPDREPLPQRLADDIAAVPGVARVQPAVDGYTQLIDKDGEAIAPMAPTIGASYGAPPLTPLVIRSGRPPAADNEINIDRHTAQSFDFALGDRVNVVTPTGTGTYTLVGVVGFGPADNLAGATLTVYTLAEAQRVLGLEGRLTEIRVQADEGVASATLAKRVQAMLPADVEAAQAETVAAQQADAVGVQLGFLRTGLLVFAAVALFVATFIIANTFSIVVAQRTREFALLRALGATGRQVTNAVLAEAAIIGTLASAVGVGFGALIALGIQSLMRAFGMSLPSGQLVIRPRTVIVGIGLGLVVTIVAAWLPARRAARIAPMAALRTTDVAPRSYSRRRAWLGGVTVLVAAALMAAGLTGWVEQAPAVTGVGVLGTFVGVAVLLPLIAGPMARLIGWFGARRGVPGQLARDNARINTRRTASTASALMIGLALVGFVATFAASLERSALSAIEEEFHADLVVQGPQARIGIGMSPVVAQRLSALGELAVVSRLRVGMARERVDGGTTFLYGIDPDTVTETATLQLVAGSLAGSDARSVFVAEDVARDRELAVGDELTLAFARTGEVALRIAGVFVPNRVMDTSYLLSNATYEANFRDVLDYFVMARVADGVTVADARAAVVAATADVPGLRIENQAEFRDSQIAQIAQLLGLVTALLLLAVGIALLGITNTLALSVFERTREIGLLRAVGMSRAQVRAMIRWEALLVAIMGAVIGVGMGALFGWAVVSALASEGIDKLVLPWGQFAVGVAVAGLAGVLAGLLPARRAARLDILDAISTP